MELDLRDVGEAALVEVALLRRLIGGQNVVGRYPGPVGESGVVIHIKRIDRVVGIDPIPGAENGCGLITAVVGEEALIHQGEQHPVCDVVADQGVHGAIGEVGQAQGLQFLVLEGQILRLLAFHQHFAALGNKIVIPHRGADTAGQGGTQQRRNQQETDMLFHRDTS